MSSFGKNIRVNIFGESHGPAIGVVIEGLKPGHRVDLDSIYGMMDRRRPGTGRDVTARKEKDRPEIISGVFNGVTTGMPLCAIIKNSDRRSGDYDEMRNIPRPGHSDYTAYVKYGGFNDVRGGGAFSGRLTAPLVFAGAMACDILRKSGIEIASHLLAVGDIEDTGLNNIEYDINQRKSILENPLPMIDRDAAKKAGLLVAKVRSDGDSIGSLIETSVYNIPAGTGGVGFDSFESNLAKVCFGVPGLKGIEFGKGFELHKMRGSEANDPFRLENGAVKTSSNNAGGLLGGISDGMPLVFNGVMKPTASIALEQDSVDLKNNVETRLAIRGRHDPCIGIRAVPVLEACAALVTLDYMMEA
jgi:chorismate synthase